MLYVCLNVYLLVAIVFEFVESDGKFSYDVSSDMKMTVIPLHYPSPIYFIPRVLCTQHVYALRSLLFA